MDAFTYELASHAALEAVWDKNVREHPDNPRWLQWRQEYLAHHAAGRSAPFLVLCNGQPVGEGTLLLSPTCSAIRQRRSLADGRRVANINALRIEKAWEGQGHISRMVKAMEKYARELGYRRLTIGVEDREARNLAIYLHWGYTDFVMAEVEEGTLVLYYGKNL